MTVLKANYSILSVTLPISCKITEGLHKEVTHVSVIVRPHGTLKAGLFWEVFCKIKYDMKLPCWQALRMRVVCQVSCDSIPRKNGLCNIRFLR